MNQPVTAEEWRRIPGFDRVYEVSNFGEVRSWSNVAKGKVLKPRIHKFTGLPQLRLMGTDGKRSWRMVHLLVSAAFPEEEK